MVLNGGSDLLHFSPLKYFEKRSCHNGQNKLHTSINPAYINKSEIWVGGGVLTKKMYIYIY